MYYFISRLSNVPFTSKGRDILFHFFKEKVTEGTLLKTYKKLRIMKTKPFIWEGTLNEEKQDSLSFSNDKNPGEFVEGIENRKIILQNSKRKLIELSEKSDEQENVYKHFF